MLNILLAAEEVAADVADTTKYGWTTYFMLVLMILVIILGVITLCALFYLLYLQHLYNKRCGHQITIEEYLKESNIKYDWEIKNILYN